MVTISQPLRELTRKNIKFKWGKKEEFKELKRRLTHPKTLGYYNKNANTRVVADANSLALGEVLTQKTPQG